MFQFVLDMAISGGRAGRIFRKIRYWVLHFYDPIVHYTFNGKRIAIPLSHDLPFTRREYPTYSANLSRLATFVRQWKGSLRMIDIGANIGDSHALAGSRPGDRFLLVDGDTKYLGVLTANTADDKGVTLVHTMLSDRSGVTNAQFISEGGTSRVEATAVGAQGSTVYQTLDELVRQHPDFASVNLLKSDVDGYDSRVLVGAQGTIASACPVIFFEHHPHLLALAKDDDTYIFSRLKTWGYSKLIFYDIKGFLLGVVDSDNETLIKDLIFYAKSKEVLCYDVCGFHDRDAEARDRFVVSEKAFYAGLIASRFVKA